MNVSKKSYTTDLMNNIVNFSDKMLIKLWNQSVKGNKEFSPIIKKTPDIVNRFKSRNRISDDVDMAGRYVWLEDGMLQIGSKINPHASYNSPIDVNHLADWMYDNGYDINRLVKSDKPEVDRVNSFKGPRRRGGLNEQYSYDTYNIKWNGKTTIKELAGDTLMNNIDDRFFPDDDYVFLGIRGKVIMPYSISATGFKIYETDDEEKAINQLINDVGVKPFKIEKIDGPQYDYAVYFHEYNMSFSEVCSKYIKNRDYYYLKLYYLTVDGSDYDGEQIDLPVELDDEVLYNII